MSDPEFHDDGCEDRTDPSSWDDPDIRDPWDEPPQVDPAPDGRSHDVPE